MTYQWPEDLVEEQRELAMLLSHELAVGGASVGFDELLDAMAVAGVALYRPLTRNLASEAWLGDIVEEGP